MGFFSILTLALYVSNGRGLEGDLVTTFVQVDSVEIILLQTFPVRIQIVAHGQKVEGEEMDVRQERKGKEVIVMITQTHARRIEPGMSKFTQHLFLQGGFTPGTYSLRVNNYLTSFEVK